jgi:DNA-binding NtrC family response regulator
MERTMLFCEGPEIRLSDLPPEIANLPPHVAPAPAAPVGPPAHAVPPGQVPEAGGLPLSPAATTLTNLPAAAPASSLKEAVRAETERVERELIQRALDETGGNVTQAARKLKISRKSLQTKMKEFGLRDQTRGE